MSAFSFLHSLLSAFGSVLLQALGIVIPSLRQIQGAPAEKKRVVIVGGGPGGATVAKLLEKDADVTLIDTKEFFEIRWATLRAMVEPKISEDIFLPHKAYLKQAKVVVGIVSKATDHDVTLKDGTAIPYDYLVLATGMATDKTVSLAERISEIEEVHQKILSSQSFLIVGGGPTGVELAAEIATDFPNKRVTLVHSGSRLLEFLPKGAKLAELSQKWMEGKGVKVMLNTRVDVERGVWGASGVHKTTTGETIQADFVASAIGNKPDALWLKVSFPSAFDHGLLNVDPTLRLEGSQNVFAVGDVANLRAGKQAYFAKIHADIVAKNIRTLIKAERRGIDPSKVSLLKNPPPADVALLSLGRDYAGIMTPLGTFMGWLPTMLKSRGLFIADTQKGLGYKAPSKVQQALVT